MANRVCEWPIYILGWYSSWDRWLKNRLFRHRRHFSVMLLEEKVFYNCSQIELLWRMQILFMLKYTKIQKIIKFIEINISTINHLII